MTTGFLFLMAVFCMVIGHILKVYRWSLLISVYEDPYPCNLLNILAAGHTINAIIPVRIGDLFRMFLAGRRLKNGYAFSIATVAADLYVDFISVGFIFFTLAFVGRGGDKLQWIAHMYGLLFFILVPVTVLCFILRNIIKKLIRFFAAVFNEKVEFGVLYVTYLSVASIKDLVRKIDKRKFILFSAGMWLGYVLSYVMIAEVFKRCGFSYTASDVFIVLFSGASLYRVKKQELFLWMAFLFFPLGICWLLSCLRLNYKENRLASRQALPQMNQADKLAFLRTYYMDEDKERMDSYIEMNKDVIVIEDNSAGSNASTVVVMKDDGNMFFRKYAFDEDAEKLQQQMDWIEQHQKDIPLPSISEKRKGSNYAVYDMHRYCGTSGLFQFIHTMPVDVSWNILKQALMDIQKGLHSKHKRHSEQEIIKKYIELKVYRNIQIMKNESRYIQDLEKYEAVTVNGNRLYTLSHYKDMLSDSHLLDIFFNDSYADIHGDLTVENIICIYDNVDMNPLDYRGNVMPKDYYFIDPNTGNIHESPFLDYAKLLQSLHGNYEFLMLVSSVKIEKNNINFMMVKSEAYSEIYHRYLEYLKQNFKSKEILSIYYHEVVNWCRLMPYKIHKNDRLAVVFYTGLLTVLADVWEMEHACKK